MGDQMFTDLAISRDLGKDYHEKREGDLIPEVMVLQQSVWPFASTKGKVTVVLPPRVRLLSHIPLPLHGPLRASHSGPSLTDLTVAMWKQLQQELNAFTEYYKNKFNGRTLDWNHSLGMVTLGAQFPKGNKRLTVSLYQAAILLLFNAEKELRFEDIKMGVAMGVSC